VLYLTKHELIEEAFGINDSVDLNKVQNMRNKLCDYLKTQGEDRQIRNILIMLEIFIVEEKYNDYDTCYEKAEPVFKDYPKPTTGIFMIYEFLLGLSTAAP